VHHGIHQPCRYNAHRQSISGEIVKVADIAGRSRATGSASTTASAVFVTAGWLIGRSGPANGWA
jgi:hypothetical protein